MQLGSVSLTLLVGHLGAKPETRKVGGSTKATFSLATNTKWKDKNSGADVEKTEWHSIEVWGPLAENCAKYLDKGARVFVQGHNEVQRWTDSNQDEHSRLVVVADEVVFL